MTVKYWGISLANRRPPASEATPNLQLFSGFDAWQLDGRMLGKLETTTALRKVSPKFLAICDVLDRSLTRQAAELTQNMWYEFQAHFFEKCQQAKKIEAKLLEADFDFIRAVADTEYRSRLRQALQLLVPSASELKIELVLPLRFPLIGVTATPQQVAATMNELMQPELNLSLELHVHEMNFSDLVLEFLHHLKYRTRVIRVVYEPELGNCLVASTMEAIVELANSWVGEQLILFSPVYTMKESLEAQLLEYHNFMPKTTI